MTALDTLTATIDHLLVELPADELSGLVATLEGGKARALARIVADAVTPKPELPLTLVDAGELARQLGLPESWVRTAARRQQIPCVHAGVHLRFDPMAVIDALKQGRGELNDRSKLSARGRTAQKHRIAYPVRAPKSLKSHGAATALLPRPEAETTV
jgi:hypothetical protein